MQMEECEGEMQYKETFYTYFQRKYGACAYSSAVLIISSTPPPPQSPSPHPIIQHPIEYAAKIPSEERVWFRDY